MHLTFVLVLTALLVWALWSASRPTPAFVIRVVGGVPRVVRGTVTPGFLQDVAQTCRRHGVSHAVVRGVVRGERIALAFSSGMPASCRQQLRNLWGLSGWSAAE
ncbi:MAG: DUF3634 family protein [Isosphaerales bacterium]